MAGSAIRITTGVTDFNGVDSGRVPLVQSQSNPRGLPPGVMAWANNCSFRQAGIQPRDGYRYRTTMPVVGLFADSALYEPAGEFPYLMSYIAGRVFRTFLDTYVTDEIPSPLNTPVDLGFTVQAERFLIHQNGIENPLFWDGETMRRSNGDSQVVGIVSVAAVAPAVGASVLLTLSAPFTGQPGDVITIGGQQYTVIAASDFITLQNDSAPTGLYPGGTTVWRGATHLTTITAPFNAPAIGGNVQVPVSPTWPSGIPLGVGFNGPTFGTFPWQVIAAGAAAIGANQVYVVNISDTPGAPIPINTVIETIPELPAGEAMDYYMGRVWIANGRQYLAGDIVRGPSGSAQYGYEDSVLKNTENSYITSGGAFTVPDQAGNIRAMKHPANINTNLGEGQLLPFTRRQIYSVNVVPTRAAWATLTEPIQRVAQINFGTTGDRTVVPVNGDLYYQSVDGVRSFQQAVREFEQVGNVPLSHEEERAIVLNDRELLRWGTGVEFNNRLLQSCLPYRVPVGVAHRGVLPLNFDVLNSISGKLPPIWEGLWEGLSVLKHLKGDFGGRQRHFALVWSELHQAIELWEQVEGAQEDTATAGDNRITWSFESPSFDWGNSFQLKELETIEIWVDRLQGKVEFHLEFRPDQYPCWTFWNRWDECSARDSCEDPGALQPCNHPEQQYLPQYRAMMVMPKPPTTCNEALGNPPHRRPMNLGFSFQLRLTVKGYARIRGIILHAYEKERAPFSDMRCAPINQFQVS